MINNPMTYDDIYNELTNTLEWIKEELDILDNHPSVYPKLLIAKIQCLAAINKMNDSNSYC